MRFKKSLIVLLYIGMLLGCMGIVWLVGYLAGEGPGREHSTKGWTQESESGTPPETWVPATPSDWEESRETEGNDAESGDSQETGETEGSGDRTGGLGQRPGQAQNKPQEVPEPEPYIPPALMLASDLHYMSRATHDGGKEFWQMMTRDDGKVSIYSEEIVDALVEEAVRTRPSALVLTGDITLNGERISHQALAGKLQKVQDAGIPVLVIPGNHDINNHHAATYFGETRQGTEYLPDGEAFLEIYHSFGYDQAASRDPASLSYVYHLDDTHWMMMLDSCQYEEVSQVNGRIRAETLEWMEDQLELAREQQAVVVPVAHHNLLSESRMYKTECTMENHQQVIGLLERYELPLYVSGHLHAQRIKKHKEAPGVEEAAYGITEIVLSPYAIPPCQYGYLAWQEDGTMAFETRQADVARLAAERGMEDPFLLNFQQEAPEFMKGMIQDQVKKTVHGVPDDLKERMTRLYAEVYYDYCAGNGVEWGDVKNTSGYTLWQRVAPDNKYVGEMGEMVADVEKEQKRWEWEGAAENPPEKPPEMPVRE
ncbi:MAG: metallophosphoesterase [Lachnospiraceae bacterium]|nr:metallophosphoesterase [Lachnospiraceae bacterium]